MLCMCVAEQSANMKLAELHARVHAGGRLHDGIAGHPPSVPSMIQYHPHGGPFHGVEEHSQLSLPTQLRYLLWDKPLHRILQTTRHSALGG